MTCQAWTIPARAAAPAARPPKQPSPAGGGVRLDGVDDGVTVPDSPDFDFGSGAFAFSFWLKLDGPNAWKDIFHWSNAVSGSGDDDLALQTDAAQHLVLYARLNGSGSTIATSTGVLTPGAWQHIVVTRDESGFIRIYLDGKSAGFGFSDFDLISSMKAPRCGSARTASANLNTSYAPLAGWLSDFRLFRRNLSQDDTLTAVSRLRRPTGAVIRRI